ncbi:MAG: endonuclease/exonuclease/phosphatase family protein [Longimicrobiales bacterium]|nr:endonuclease/exonuclease/phosphatase family protein [Longimicrobiales bacterium]MDE0837181.1 endonuclease/exonuclease/phosphatase family protein [Akkermansiaceae bacterium]
MKSIPDSIPSIQSLLQLRLIVPRKFNLSILALLTLNFSPQLCCLHAEDSKPKKTLTVLTYNIYGARTGVDRIAKVIQTVNPDLVALQEVDHNAVRSKRLDQTKELARLTGLNYYIYEATGTYPEINQDPYKKNHPALAGPEGLYARTIGEDGFRGIAVLSRYPIVRQRIVPLPGGYHPRDLIVATIQFPTSENKTREITFISTHLSVNSREARLRSVELIGQTAKNTKHPVLLAGDMNALPNSQTLKALYSQGWLNPAIDKPIQTIPVKAEAKNARQIDYVFQFNSKWKTLKAGTENSDRTASDHLPYLVTFQID